VRWGFKRPSVIPPAATRAEESLAGRYGWNLPVFRGEVAVDGGGGSGAFLLSVPEDGLPPEAPPEVLRLNRWMRFGNSVFQLQNVFNMAERYGARRLEFPKPHPFFTGFHVGGIELAWQPSADPSPGAGPQRSSLTGEFFFLAALGKRPTSVEQAGAMARYVRPLLVPALQEPHPRVRDGDLVLHFRAGDIFAREGFINPLYGQPPLAYYLAAVDRERPSRVWLVFEDRGNPAIGAAEAALRERGIEVLTQSGELAADLHLLLHAPCLVASVGTFCPAIASLSTRTRKVYLFGPRIQSLLDLGVHTVEARDREGIYHRAVRSMNWQATPEQIALMLSYPAAALDFVDHEPTTRGPAAW
jgi:hypothetical protein